MHGISFSFWIHVNYRNAEIILCWDQGWNKVRAPAYETQEMWYPSSITSYPPHPNPLKSQTSYKENQPKPKSFKLTPIASPIPIHSILYIYFITETYEFITDIQKSVNISWRHIFAFLRNTLFFSIWIISNE